MKSKQITGLNLRAKTITLLEENRGDKNLCDFVLGKQCLDATIKAQSTEEKNKEDFIKDKHFVCKRLH